MFRWMLVPALLAIAAACRSPRNTATVATPGTAMRPVATSWPLPTPAPAPHGALIFRATGTGRFDYFRVRPDGTGLRQLTTEPATSALASWSPDGTAIAFTRDDRVHTQAPDGDQPRDLTPDDHVYVMEPDGSRPKDLARGVFVSWSPDATRILFGFFGESYGEWWVMDRDGTRAVRIVPRCRACATPQWAPDSRGLLAQMPADGLEGMTKTGLFVVGLDGVVQRRLPDAPTPWNEFRWSPDGRFIAYVTGATTGQGTVWVMRADGGGARDVWHGDEPHALIWAPDSARIAFVASGVIAPAPGSPSPPTTFRKLITLDPTSGIPRELVTGAWIGELAWSPDGTQIAYTAPGGSEATAAHLQVYVVPAAEGAPVDVSNGPWADSSPQWSPDGRELIFGSDRNSRDGLYWFDSATSTTGILELLPPGAAPGSAFPTPSLEGGCIPATVSSALLPGLACLSPDRRLQATATKNALLVTSVADGGTRASTILGLKPEYSPPAWSPDGTRVAFLAREDGATSLYTLDVATGRVTRLVPADARANASQTVLWLRDGARIYFTRGSVCRGGCAPGYLYDVRADGTGERKLSSMEVMTLFGFAR